MIWTDKATRFREQAQRGHRAKAPILREGTIQAVRGIPCYRLWQHTVGLMIGASTEQSNIGFSTNQTFNRPFPNDAINYSFDESTLTVGNSDVTQMTPNRLVSYF